MIPFHAEELQNINTLRACISAKPGYDVAKELKVESNRLILGSDVVVDLSAVNVTVNADTMVVSQSYPVSERVMSHSYIPWEVKLNLVETSRRQWQQNDVKEWWTAKDLLQLGNSSNKKDIQSLQLQCRSCCHPLIDYGLTYSVKDLPSEHWYELVECWICHEAKAEEHKSRMRPILARTNTLLVGTTYFLVHADNIIQDTIETDSVVAERLNWDRGTMTKWILLNCKNCKHPLGEGHYTKGNDDRLNLLAAKLFKYSTRLSVSSSPPPHQPSFIDFFVSDLVNTARVHATHRFIIQGRQSERIYALIWLFNWDTHIIHNNGYIDDQNTSHQLQRQRVIKVMYLDCTDDSEKELTRKYATMWMQDKSTDHLLYPDTFCNELLKHLNHSTLILPPSMRKIYHPGMIFTQNFSVGFIPRSID